MSINKATVALTFSVLILDSHFAVNDVFTNDCNSTWLKSFKDFWHIKIKHVS